MPFAFRKKEEESTQFLFTPKQPVVQEQQSEQFSFTPVTQEQPSSNEFSFTPKTTQPVSIKKSEESTLGIVDAFKAKANDPLSLVPFLSSAKDIKKYSQIGLAINRYNKGEATDSDNKLISNLIAEEEAMSKQKTSFGYKVVDTSLASIPFMGEMAVAAIAAPFTGGGSVAGKAGTIVAKEAGKRTIEEVVKSRMKKVLKEEVGKKALTEVVKSQMKKALTKEAAKGFLFKVGVSGATRIPAETIRNILPGMQEVAPGRFVEAREGKNAVTSLKDAMLNHSVEVMSEMSGGFLGKVGGALIPEKLAKSALGSLVAKANGIIPKNKFTSLASIDGVIEEMGEERFGEVLRGVMFGVGVTDDEGFEYKVPTLEQLAVEAVSFGITGGSFRAISYLGKNDLDLKDPRLYELMKDFDQETYDRIPDDVKEGIDIEIKNLVAIDKDKKELLSRLQSVSPGDAELYNAIQDELKSIAEEREVIIKNTKLFRESAKQALPTSEEFLDYKQNKENFKSVYTREAKLKDEQNKIESNFLSAVKANIERLSSEESVKSITNDKKQEMILDAWSKGIEVPASIWKEAGLSESDRSDNFKISLDKDTSFEVHQSILENRFFMERDWKHAVIEIRTRDYQKQLLDMYGETRGLATRALTFSKRKYGEEAKLHDMAIQIYNDSKRDPVGAEKYEKEISNQITEEIAKTGFINIRINSLKKALGAIVSEQHAKDINDQIAEEMANKELIEAKINSLNKKLDVIDLSKKLPAKDIELAERISEAYKETGLDALNSGVINNILTNYAGRRWAGKDGGRLGEKDLEFVNRHAKQRTIDTIVEGWAGGRELALEGATTNYLFLAKEINNTVSTRRLIEAMSASINSEGKYLLDATQHAGYSKVNDPIFKTWINRGKVGVKEEGRVLADKKYEDGGAYVDSDGNLWTRQDLYAPDQQAAILNKIFGKSSLKGIKAIDAVSKYNTIVKQFVLMSSYFHHLAYMRSYYLGAMSWADFKDAEARNISSAYKSGLKSIQDMHPTIKLLVENGLTLGLKQDWEEGIRNQSNVISEAIDKVPGGKKVKDGLLELRDAHVDFLFSEFGAGLKAKAAMLEFARLTQEFPTENPSKIASIVANLINDDFGGLHLQRMHRNPTVQHVFSIFALAPDWTESNIRTMVKMLNKSTKKGHIGSKSELETKVYRRFWAGILTKGFMATTVANIMLGMTNPTDPDEKEKKMLQATGSKHFDVDITGIYKMLGGETDNRKYFSIIGHFKDPFKFITNPVGSAKHKGSIVFNFFYDLLSGKDWRGRPFTTLDELLGIDEKGVYEKRYKENKRGDKKGGKLAGKTTASKFSSEPFVRYNQAPSFLLNQAGKSMPVQVQNLMQWLKGERDGFDMLFNSLGLNISSTYSKPDKNDKEALARLERPHF